MTAIRCTRRGCGTTLTERHDRTLGRIAFVCVPCERNKAGQCRDCPAPLDEPKRMRCEACRIRRKREVWRGVSRRQRADETRWDRIKARRRQKYATNPDRRAKALADNKAWREKHPRKADNLDRLYKRLKAREYRAKRPEIVKNQTAANKERYHADPEFRARVLEQQRERRKHLSPEARARDNERRRRNAARQRAEAQGVAA